MAWRLVGRPGKYTQPYRTPLLQDGMLPSISKSGGNCCAFLLAGYGEQRTAGQLNDRTDRVVKFLFTPGTDTAAESARRKIRGGNRDTVSVATELHQGSERGRGIDDEGRWIPEGLALQQ